MFVSHTHFACATPVDETARKAPVRGLSVRKRVIRLQIIEKSVESSRSSPETGAGEGIRTLDPNLGKVVLYP